MAYEDSVYIVKHKIGISDETEVLNYIKFHTPKQLRLSTVEKP